MAGDPGGRREELTALCDPLRADLDAAPGKVYVSEYTAALVDGRPLPGPDEVDVGLAAWLCGLAEAASELRRHLLDVIRAGDLERGQELLGVMEDVYDLLVTVDYPDALTGGLRRTTDSLRAVLERSRADVTTTVIQSRLQAALERRIPPNGDAP